jgi:hypothetical protein
LNYNVKQTIIFCFAFRRGRRLSGAVSGLAQHQEQEGDFQARLARNEEQNARRRALMERLRKAGLI